MLSENQFFARNITSQNYDSISKQIVANYLIYKNVFGYTHTHTHVVK